MPLSGPKQPLTFIDGLKAALPVVIAYVPIGFSFGITATNAGLSAAESLLLSLVIYSGAAQFLAVALFTSGAPLLVSILTLAAMNLRHLLYGPALLKAANAGDKTKLSWLWAFGLTDEVFGAAIGRIAGSRQAFSEPFMLGTGLAAYTAWCGGTALGAAAGGDALNAWPILHAALTFLYPAMFLSFLLSILSRPQMASVLTATLATLAGMGLFSTAVGIIGGMMSGAAFGAFRSTQLRKGGLR